MKYKALVLAILLCVCMVLPMGAATAEAQEVEVYLGGTHISVDLVQDGLVVMGMADVETPLGLRSPARDAGLEIGDVLTQVDGDVVRTRYDVERALERAAGNAVRLQVSRDGRSLALQATPVPTRAEGYVLGVYLKDGVQGVGTLTYVRCDDHRYAALGHGVEDPDTGAMAEPYRGKVYPSTVTDIVRGRAGYTGELQGTVCAGEPIGSVEANTPLGIYGHADVAMYEHLPRVKVAGRDEVEEGDAVIVCALDDDKPRYYAVRITQCRRQDEPQAKGMSITVTDQRLLRRTGGIVQGMSGSPILQNGRLVGAVTHVTVDNPAKGYGVYIDFMMQG